MNAWPNTLLFRVRLIYIDLHTLFHIPFDIKLHEREQNLSIGMFCCDQPLARCVDLILLWVVLTSDHPSYFTATIQETP